MKEKVENGLDLESDTLLVVTLELVNHLNKVDSGGFNFEDIKTVKSGKMFKVSSKARFFHEQVRQKWLTLMFSVHKSTDCQFVAL